MCKKEINIEKSRNYRICEKHFQVAVIRTSSERKGLMYKAVPTLDFHHMVIYFGLIFYSKFINLFVQRKIAAPKNLTSMASVRNQDFMSMLEPEVKVKEEPNEDYDDHQPTATVIQTYINEEQLDIKQEVIDEDPLALPDYNPALIQLQEIAISSQSQRKRRSRAVIMSKPLKPSMTFHPPEIKNKKHIMCFICFDKFTSTLTFNMHLKLMHKNVKNP